MYQNIVDLLSRPRWMILNEIDIRSCPHEARFDHADAACRYCELKCQCQWLAEHDDFIDLARKSADELMAALDFAMIYVRDRYASHNTIACVCDACDWLRAAKREMRKLEWRRQAAL